jgi:hypothetical protein
MGEHCKAVELLLARMDSNPEEFGDGGRWEKHIIKYRSYLPVQDRLALEDKINALRMDVFHRDVMKELLVEPNEFVAVSTIPVGGISPVGRATTLPFSVASAYGNQCISPNTNAAANINLSQQSIKEIASALGAYANVWRP